MRLIGRAGITWLTLGLLLVQAGCATGLAPVPPRSLPSLPPEIRAQLGRVGVVSGRFVPATVVERPAAGKVRGAAKGAAAGALGVTAGMAGAAAFSRVGCSGEGCALAAVIGLGVLIGAATVGTVVGAIVGAVTTESAVKAREAQAALQHAYAELNIQQTLRDRIVSIARAEAQFDLIPVADPSPADPDVDVDYRPLVAQDLDTVFEVSVTGLGLTGDRSVNPPLALSATTRIRVIRSRDGAELYRHDLPYRNGSRKFVEWAANDAAAFREALDAAYTDISRQIIRLVWPSAQFPPAAVPPPPAPEPSLSAVPINVWKTAPIGEQGATVRYQLIEKGSPLDTCTPPLVSIRIYEDGVQCAPAGSLK